MPDKTTEPPHIKLRRLSLKVRCAIDQTMSGMDQRPEVGTPQAADYTVDALEYAARLRRAEARVMDIILRVLEGSDHA